MVSFLQHKGVELSELYDLTDLPAELLKDPTCWLPAAKLEQFLVNLDDRHHEVADGDSLLEKVGHSAHELKAWGVLDSVLRMLDSPVDIFTQPQRFISYFVSPSPPIGNFKKLEKGVQFDLPISHDEYPATVIYLKAAFEALPLFMGSEMAHVTWEQTRIQILWQPSQVTFDSGEVTARQMAPEFMSSIIATLEKTEKALATKTKELEKIKTENKKASQSKTSDLEHWFRLYRNLNRYAQEVHKLQDYFIRSQQLVTLLVGQDRMSPQVKEAMKRVNWDSIQKSYPEVVQGLIKQLEDEKKYFNPENLNAKNQQGSRPRDPGQPWLSNS